MTGRVLRLTLGPTWAVVKIMVPIRVMVGLFGDNGKENGNYYNGLHG